MNIMKAIRNLKNYLNLNVLNLNKCIKLISLVFLFFCSSSFAKMGYVDFEKVLSKTKEGKRIEIKLKKEFESRKKSIQKREKKLQAEQMKLRSEASLLSESEKTNRIQQMQQKAMEFQRSLEVNQRELDGYKNRLINSIRDKMKPILKKIAKSKGFELIERKTEKTLWIKKELDITNVVIKSYNKKYK